MVTSFSFARNLELVGLSTFLLCLTWGLGDAQAAIIQTRHGRSNATAAKVKPIVQDRQATRAHHQRAARVNSSSSENIDVRRTRVSLGGGMMRRETADHSVQTVTQQLIKMRNPAGTALDMMKNMPSLSVSTVDTSGMHGGAINSRSLTDSDMALLVDGAVVTSGVAYIQENVDAENIDRIEVTPGSSSIDQPVTAAALGVMNVHTHNPSDHFGGMMDFSYGTNNMSRQFIRLESGYIGNSGLKGYFSFSHTHARQWAGAGTAEKRAINFGLKKNIGKDSWFKFYTAWLGTAFPLFQYPTQAAFSKMRQTGESWGLSNNPSNSKFWGANREGEWWNELFITAPLHLKLASPLAFDLVPYFAYGRGWSANTTNRPSGDLTYNDGRPVAADQTTVSYFDQRTPTTGVTARFTYDVDRHNQLIFGYWYGYTQSMNWSPYSATNSSGYAVNPDNYSYNYYKNGERLQGQYQQTGYNIHALFLQESGHYLNDKLTFSAGFKFAMQNYWFDNYLTGNRMGANTVAPLPRFSIGYKINKHHQIYLNAQGDFRSPSASNLNTNTSFPKNQYSIKEELGYRYDDKYVTLDVSLFNYNITNRLMTVMLANNSNATVNAGNQTARGVDVMIAAKPVWHFSPFASVEYLHATEDSNIPYGTSFLPTKGKVAIMSPRIMANFGLTYDDSRFFANVAIHYTGPQSVTLVNDQRIPGYITNSLSLGYRMPSFYYAKDPVFRLNFTNITGALIRTGATGVTNNYRPITLLNGTTIAGSSGASFYVEPRFSMTGTLSTSF